EPGRHRFQERPEAERRVGEVGLEQPLELLERLFVEDDLIDRRERDPGFAQAIVDRAAGERGVVTLAGEALLLAGGGDPPVGDERGGAVVVVGRDAEDPGHVPSSICYGAALSWGAASRPRAARISRSARAPTWAPRTEGCIPSPIV